MNRRKALAVVAAMVLLSSSVLGGCGKESESTVDEVSVSVEATTVAATATTKATEPSKDKSTEAVTTETVETTEAQVVYSEPEAVYVPENNNNDCEPEDSGVCTLNVDGKTYEAEVGDTITYVFNLKTPEALEDFQATTNYDSGMLELLPADTKEMFPVAGNIVVCNTELENMVKYNAVNLSGMDFTKGGVFISLDFRVKDSGGTSVGTTLEYMDSIKSEPYVNDYRIVGNIDYSEEIKLGN